MVTIISPIMTTNSTICQKPFCYSDTRKVLQEDQEEYSEEYYNSTKEDSTTTTTTSNDDNDELLQVPWDDDNFSLCLESFPTCSAQIQKLIKSYPATSSPLRQYWVNSTEHFEADDVDDNKQGNMIELKENKDKNLYETEAQVIQLREMAISPYQQQQQRQLENTDFFDEDDQQHSIVTSSAITCPTLPGIREEEEEEIQAIMMMASSPSANTTRHFSASASPTTTRKFMRKFSHSLSTKKRAQTSSTGEATVTTTTTTKVALLKRQFESISKFPYNNSSTTTLLLQPPSPQQHHEKQQQARTRKQQQVQQQQLRGEQQAQVPTALQQQTKRVEHISPLNNSSLILKDKDDPFNMVSMPYSREMSNASSVHSAGPLSQQYLQQHQGEGWKLTQQLSERSSVRSLPIGTITSPTAPMSPTTAYYANAPLPLRYSPLARLGSQTAPTTRSTSPRSTSLYIGAVTSSTSPLHPYPNQQHQYGQTQQRQQHQYHDNPSSFPQQQRQPSTSILQHQNSVHSAISSANSYQHCNDALSYQQQHHHHQQEISHNTSPPLKQQQQEPQRYKLHDAPSPSSSTPVINNNSSPAPSIANTSRGYQNSGRSVPVHTSNADRLIFYNEIYESRRPYSTYFVGKDAQQRYLVDYGTDMTKEPKESKKKNKSRGSRANVASNKRTSKVGVAAATTGTSGQYQVYPRKKSVGLFTKLMKSLKQRFL